jgi:hypothetical protein
MVQPGATKKGTTSKVVKREVTWLESLTPASLDRLFYTHTLGHVFWVALLSTSLCVLALVGWGLATSNGADRPGCPGPRRAAHSPHSWADLTASHVGEKVGGARKAAEKAAREALQAPAKLEVAQQAAAKKEAQKQATAKIETERKAATKKVAAKKQASATA